MGSFFDAILGTTVHAPDGTEGDAAAALTPYHEEVRRRDLMVRGLSGIGQAVIPPPSYDRVQVSPAAAMAMGPQGLQHTYARDMEREGMFNQRQQAGERNRLAERQMLMQATQAEKDRQAQLQYQTLQFRNSEKDRKLRQDMADAEAKQRAEEAEADRDYKNQAADRDQQGRIELQRMRNDAMSARSGGRGGGGGGSAPIDGTPEPVIVNGVVTGYRIRTGPNSFQLLDPNGNRLSTGQNPTFRQLPDGTYAQLDPTTNTGAPTKIEGQDTQKIPLSDIATKTKGASGNNKRALFLTDAILQGYSDKEAEAYADTQGIKDNVGWGWGPDKIQSTAAGVRKGLGLDQPAAQPQGDVMTDESGKRWRIIVIDGQQRKVPA